MRALRIGLRVHRLLHRRSDLRGRGIGTRLFDQALARAGDRVVGLDGVLAQQPVYASLGLELFMMRKQLRTLRELAEAQA